MKSKSNFSLFHVPENIYMYTDTATDSAHTSYKSYKSKDNESIFILAKLTEFIHGITWLSSSKNLLVIVMHFSVQFNFPSLIEH